MLDPAQRRQDAGSALGIGDLQHDRCDQLSTLRNQRVIGRELVGDLARTWLASVLLFQSAGCFADLVEGAYAIER